MPRDLYGQWTGFTSLTLSWRAPEMTQGGIVGYLVTYHPTSSNMTLVYEVLTVNLSDASNVAIMIGSLGLFTEYNFTVHEYVHIPQY